MNILLTGGSGRLGKELQKYIECDAPSSQMLDITKELDFSEGFYDLVIHAAAYTDVVEAEKERAKCFKVNVDGTDNMLGYFPNAKFIYISSEYAFNPVNFYGWTKLWGEQLVEKHLNHLIIRTSFLESPFAHEAAFTDQYTRGDYLDIIAPMIAAEILKGTSGIVHLGTERKTVFQLAQRTNPAVDAISVDDIKSVRLPHDYQ